jgi:hypothetical protein
MLYFAAIFASFAFATLHLQLTSMNGVQAGKLLEAAEYSACDYNCAPFNRPTIAYCIQAGSETLVGERPSIFGETPSKSLRSLVGHEVAFRTDPSSIWLFAPDRTELKIKRGSLFEQFKENRCIAAVHKPILAAALADNRPSQIPSTAFALSARGETAPHYRWFQCSMSPDASGIVCKKWDSKGVWNGVDRYCPRTREGTPVPADFEIDRLLSREGHIILQTGQILIEDDRGRINDQLMRPEETCKQTAPSTD